MFRPRKPSIRREELADQTKIRAFIVWWVKNDNRVDVANVSIHLIFTAGCQPKIFVGQDPEGEGQQFDSPVDWFVAKVSGDLQALSGASKQQFKDFIDSLTQAGTKTLVALGEAAEKYRIDCNFVYAREINKIPEGEERLRFNQNLLDDCMVWSESRILGWVYQQWFGEAYQPPEAR